MSRYRGPCWSTRWLGGCWPTRVVGLRSGRGLSLHPFGGLLLGERRCNVAREQPQHLVVRNDAVVLRDRRCARRRGKRHLRVVSAVLCDQVDGDGHDGADGKDGQADDEQLHDLDHHAENQQKPETAPRPTRGGLLLISVLPTACGYGHGSRWCDVMRHRQFRPYRGRGRSGIRVPRSEVGWPPGSVQSR
jgi:hypothetical protein